MTRAVIFRLLMTSVMTDIEKLALSYGHRSRFSKSRALWVTLHCPFPWYGSSLWLSSDSCLPPPQHQPAIHSQPHSAGDSSLQLAAHTGKVGSSMAATRPKGTHPSLTSQWRLPSCPTVIALAVAASFLSSRFNRQEAITSLWFRCALKLMVIHFSTFQELSSCSKSAAIPGWT